MLSHTAGHDSRRKAAGSRIARGGRWAGGRGPGRAGRETRATGHGTRRTVRLSAGRAAGRGLINCSEAQTKTARRGAGRLEVQGGD